MLDTVTFCVWYGNGAWDSLTCYRLRMTRAFAASYEDDISLTSVGVLVLKEKELVDAVFLKRRDLHNSADGAG